LPAQLLVNNFQRQGTVFVVKDELKKFVDFRQMNLAAQNWSIGGPVDMVFLRNVLIYFSAQTKKEILNRVKRILRSDGILVLGST
ncbi:CheR family methyltransferase, partial [Pseudomonas syringae]|uniref:CheR family methyltransferase n=1 Tax=Pseudomonas syringae TaxID=317 RepID=UPI0034D955B0